MKEHLRGAKLEYHLRYKKFFQVASELRVHKKLQKTNRLSGKQLLTKKYLCMWPLNTGITSQYSSNFLNKIYKAIFHKH